jgi:GNAT superfamily N-acetyltransferase
LPFPLITPELIARIERFSARFNIARMEALRALDGNPYGVEICPFGRSIAVKVRSSLLRGKNRIIGFQPGDAPRLDEMLEHFRADGLRCTLSVPYGQMTQPLFRHLVAAGLWSGGSGTIPVIVPKSDGAPPGASPIAVHESPPEEKEIYLDLFARAFAHREEGRSEYLAFQWVEDTLPGCRRYVAEIDRTPVGMASFPILDGVGFFGTAGTVPEYRGRGVQMALLKRRLADAPRFGCNLVIGGGSLFSPPHRNFERAGLRLVPLGTGWVDGGV